MASLRTPILRHLSTTSCRLPRTFLQQRRWAQVHDVRFLTTQPPQVILEKYRSKLSEKAKQEGHGTIDDLKAAYADKITEQRKKDAIDEALKIPEFRPEAPLESEPNATQSKNASTPPKTRPAGVEKAAIKTLNEIIDLEKARTLPEKELTAIWRLRHATSPQNLCAVIPASTYQAMEDAARRAPQFVLPVPHKTQGAEIHFLQWTFDAASKTSTVLFTQLAEYKTRGEFAQPHTTITHHLDLAKDNGLVLMQGQVMDDRGVKLEHAKWLLMSLQRFYGGWNDGIPLDGERLERAEARKQLLEWFATGNENFSVEKLMEEAERMG